MKTNDVNAPNTPTPNGAADRLVSADQQAGGASDRPNTPMPNGAETLLVGPDTQLGGGIEEMRDRKQPVLEQAEQKGIFVYTEGWDMGNAGGTDDRYGIAAEYLRESFHPDAYHPPVSFKKKDAKPEDAPLQPALVSEAAAATEAQPEETDEQFEQRARTTMATIANNALIEPNYLLDAGRKSIAEKANDLTSALNRKNYTVARAKLTELETALDDAIYLRKEGEAQQAQAQTAGVPDTRPFAHGNVPQVWGPADVADDVEKVEMFFPHRVVLSISPMEQLVFESGNQMVPASLENHSYLAAHGVKRTEAKQYSAAELEAQPGALKVRDR